MSIAVKGLLEAFERLSEPERREALDELLQWSIETGYGPLDEESMNRIAEESFLEYDRREDADGRP